MEIVAKTFPIRRKLLSRELAPLTPLATDPNPLVKIQFRVRLEITNFPAFRENQFGDSYARSLDPLFFYNKFNFDRAGECLSIVKEELS